MSYQAQQRGSQAAYAAYYAGMNKSMRQKTALISGFFPVTGRVADMGCGSGQGSYDLSQLYPDLEVVGVDISPESVAYAQGQYNAPNLSFAIGDIAKPVFEPDYLDGILNSSVLHHVTSFNEFDTQHIDTLFDAQVDQLKSGGILAVRDFVVPDGPEMVDLTLANDDGDSSDDVNAMSTAAAMRKFAREFRCSLFSGTGFELDERPGTGGKTVFRVPLRLAAEFILRKDYRADWDVEILEEYLYFSRAQFEQAYEQRGLRILISKPIYNPWIVRNRFAGHVELHDLKGGLLDYPPTNYLIVGEKVRKQQSVRVVETSAAAAEPQFLARKTYQRSDDQSLWDTCLRPHRTIDVVPYTIEDGAYRVYVRQGYPRPLLAAGHKSPNLDETLASGFVSGPLNFIADSSLEPEQQLRQTLHERWGFPADGIAKIEHSLSYYPSPGGIHEVVDAYFVEVTAEQGSAAEQIEKLDVHQLLRSYQIGGMFDSRLELNLLDLLLSRSADFSPWIGDELRPTVDVAELPGAQCAPSSVTFAEHAASANFLEIYRGQFTELAADGSPVAEHELEYACPRHASTNTVVAIPYVQQAGQYCLGLEQRQLPTPWLYDGRADLLCAPAWRLPQLNMQHWEVEAWLRDQLQVECGVRAADFCQLGGSYHPTVGCTPETVTVFAVALAEPPAFSQNIHWHQLSELVNQRRELRDGHLLSALLRFLSAV